MLFKAHIHRKQWPIFFGGISLANSLVCHQPAVKLLSLEMIGRNWMPDFCVHLLT